MAMLSLQTQPTGLSAQFLLGPSDDGSTLSNKASKYPLVLIAPPQNVAAMAMQGYANQLCTHGFIVGVYQVADQSDHTGYRDTALAYLDTILNDTVLGSHIDTNHLGLMGYELGAKISIAMAVQDASIAALFLIDPADLFAMSGAIDGVMTMSQLKLPAGGTVVMLGEPNSTMGTSPCIQPPQRGYSAFYTAANSPAEAITFNGANLGDFMNGFPTPQCTTGSTTPQSQTQALAMKYMTAYFQWTLSGETFEQNYLLGNEFLADMQAANLTRQSK